MDLAICVIPTAHDRARLTAIMGDRRRPLKHVQRASIIVLSAERLPVAQVPRRAGVSCPAVWRWQKVEDIVGLYMYPPAHAVVLLIDEKSHQIQAFDRSRPGLPLKKGRAGTYQ